MSNETSKNSTNSKTPWGWYIVVGILILALVWKYVATNYDITITTDSPVAAAQETLSVEQHFPASFVGAGISEVTDQSTGFCAVIKSVNGDQMTWGGKGSFWTGSEAVVNARFGKHVQEYKAKYPHCYVYNSVTEFYAHFMADLKAIVPDTNAPSVEAPADSVTDKVIDTGFRKYRLDADWIGDDFDIEHTLPNTVVGPAITEVKPFMGQVCFTLRVNEGESFTTEAGGAYWPAGSQGALVERWMHHVAEYKSHYSECASNVYDSVEAFLAANPTHR